ncbi:MAG: archease [Methanobacteriota archaeon]|nr:MAG: archease [Euryarchaeota archaeon]
MQGVGKYTFLEHTADIKIRAEGKSLADAIEGALNGLASVIRGEDTREDGEELEIDVNEEFLEDAVVMAMEQLLVKCEVEKFSPSQVKVLEVEEQPYHINAIALGKRVDEVETIVKAITYHQLKIEEKEGKYIIEVVLDI